VDINLIEDFSTHIRLLFVIPFLLIFEKHIEKSIDTYISTMSLLVKEKDTNRFKRIIEHLKRLSHSFVPEIIILILIGLAIYSNWSEYDPGTTSWNLRKEGLGFKFSYSGLYYAFISFPIYQLMMGRWIWRWLTWDYSLFRFSKLDCTVDATHADKIAGLKFLNIVPLNFGILSISTAAVLSSIIGMEIIYYGHSLNEYITVIAAFVVLIPLLIFSPLLFFIPSLIKVKMEAMTEYGGIIRNHNLMYKAKWITGKQPESENILGNVDNSSLADINSAYQQSVSQMSLIPIDARSLVSVMILLLLLFLPLLGTLYSLSELLSKLIEVLMG